MKLVVSGVVAIGSVLVMSFFMFTYLISSGQAHRESKLRCENRCYPAIAFKWSETSCSCDYSKREAP